MKKKIGYAVFTKTGSGLDYMVKGNFGNDEDAAEKWAENHVNDQEWLSDIQGNEDPVSKYPNGLFVKKIKY